MDGSLQTLSGGGERREGAPRGLGFQTPVGEERGRAPAVDPTGKGPDRAWGPGNGNRWPSPLSPCGSEVHSPPLTSEHRLGPRDHGNHHGLLVVLSFLTLERHLEAVERRGSFCSEGHGEAKKGDPKAEDGRAGLGAPPVAAASRPGLRRARGPSSSPARRPPGRPASRGLQLVTTPGGEGSIRGPRPRRSLLRRLIVSVHPAAPPPGPDGQSREVPPLAPPQARAGQNPDGARTCWVLLVAGRPGVGLGRGVCSREDPAGQPHLPLTKRALRGGSGISLDGFPSTSRLEGIPTKKERRGVGRTSAQNPADSISSNFLCALFLFTSLYARGVRGGKSFWILLNNDSR